MPTHPRFATAIAKADCGTRAAAVSAAFLLGEENDNRAVDGADLAPRVRNLFQGGNSRKAGFLDYATRISKEARQSIQTVLDDKVSALDVSNTLGESLLVPGFIDLVAQRKSDASYEGLRTCLQLDGQRVWMACTMPLSFLLWLTPALVTMASQGFVHSLQSVGRTS
jgi:hypothetical protein